MSKVKELLIERERWGEPIKNAVIGVGAMGAGIVDVMLHMDGMAPSFVADIDLDRARQSLLAGGVSEGDIIECDDPISADKHIAEGKYVIAKDGAMAANIESLETVVEATGIPEIGSNIALKTIMNNKHIVMMNVETDVVVGPILKKMADAAGVVYTGACGDEPACTMELFDFATSLGLDVVCAGKGKNTPLDTTVNPDNLLARFPKFSSAPNARMICEFIDGSKTAIEMAALSNASGLAPEVRGMHGPSSDVEGLSGVFALKEDGGVVENMGIVDYCIGVAPGVFCIVKGNYKTAIEQFGSFAKGSSNGYGTLYRPYHLTSLEVALSSAKAVLLHEAAIAPIGELVSEVITVAKKDLSPGDVLDGIGGFSIYGSIDKAPIARKDNLLPLGLAPGSVVKNNIKRGDFITYADVDLNTDATIVMLRKMQDKGLAL